MLRQTSKQNHVERILLVLIAPWGLHIVKEDYIYMQSFITTIHHQTSSVKLGGMRTVKASLSGHTPTSLTSNFEMICVCLPFNRAWMGSKADSVTLYSSLLSYVPLEHCQWHWLGDDLSPWFSLLILFTEEYVVLRGWVPLLGVFQPVWNRERVKWESRFFHAWQLQIFLEADHDFESETFWAAIRSLLFVLCVITLQFLV